MSNQIRKEYSPADATLAALGKEVEGWKKISYSAKVSGTKNKSGNGKTTSYSIGNGEEECKIEIYKSLMLEWQRVNKERTGKSTLLGMAIEFAVTFANDDLEETTDIISVVLMSEGSEIAGGTDGLAYEVETMCLEVAMDA